MTLEKGQHIETGIVWLKDIPSHWELIKMRYLCDITTGDKDTENREDDGKYPFFVRSQTIEKISTFSFDGEAILTAGDGVGVCKVWHYVNGKFDFHQRVYMMSNFKKVSGSFLFYFLKENFIHEVLKLSAKSTVDSLRRPMFLDFPVAVPPLQEQTQIAKYLDYQTNIIDQLIEKKENLVSLLHEQRQAIINEAVTKGLDPNAKMKDSGIEWLGEIPEKWTIAKTKHITINVTDGAHVSPDLSSDDFPFISTVNIGNRGQIDWANCLHTSSESYHSLVANGCRPKIGDVLYSKDGTIGKTTIIDFEREFVVASSLLIIRPNPDLIESEFLNYLFHSNFVNQQIDQLLSGVALRRISITKFSNLEMIIPPLNVQKKIVNAIKAKVNLLNSVLDLINDQIIKLKEYRQSIISEAVTGKIDLREWKAPKSAIA